MIRAGADRVRLQPANAVWVQAAIRVRPRHARHHTTVVNLNTKGGVKERSLGWERYEPEGSESCSVSVHRDCGHGSALPMALQARGKGSLRGGASLASDSEGGGTAAGPTACPRCQFKKMMTTMTIDYTSSSSICGYHYDHRDWHDAAVTALTSSVTSMQKV